MTRQQRRQLRGSFSDGGGYSSSSGEDESDDEDAEWEDVGAGSRVLGGRVTTIQEVGVAFQ